MTERSSPLLVYDGDCGFCRLWIARWRRTTGDRIAYAPFQKVAGDFPGVPREHFAAAVHLLEDDGRWSSGAEAVFRSLAYAPRHGWMLALYRRVPGFAAVSEWCYRRVARHRTAATRITRLLWGLHVAPPGETRTAWLFLRLLGLIYAIAFISLWTQIIGLAGSQGILPAREFLDAVRGQYGVVRYWLLPTLVWLDPGNGFLLGLCAAGTGLSLLLAAGVAPPLTLFGAWATYLSLTNVGRNFLWFQWDSLLLEAGFLALFLAPWRWWSRPRDDPPPSRGAVWLMRWLLFRLMFSSAAVKIVSHDPSWHGLTALEYHYETQCLPPWTAWYAYHLPAWFQKASAGAMFVIEGLVPFLIFAPRRLRFAGAGALAFLQVLILISGNYGFFNLLTLALCVMLLDDGVWPARWQVGAPAHDGATATAKGDVPETSIAEEGEDAGAPRAGRRLWHAWVTRPAMVLLVLMSLVPLLRAMGWPSGWLGPVRTLYAAAAPFRIVNSYGLFAVMTTERREIVVEGSDDGVNWKPYAFRYKPGDLRQRPPFVTPHMPRLDWQMWFAALDDYRREPWFLHFCERLLQGSHPVEALLAGDPFPEHPPRYIRAVVYVYHFTTAAERRSTGDWWQRDLLGLYCPVLTLQDGHLVAVQGAAPPPASP